MIEFIAAIISTLFTLFWIAVQITGWLIVACIVAAPIAWVVSLFIEPSE